MDFSKAKDAGLNMQRGEYKNIFLNEGDHFFYVANHKLVLQLLENFLPIQKKELNILDAGCGTGLLAKKLERFGSVKGIDVSPEAVEFSSQRGINAKIGSVNKLTFDDNSFDVVVSIDVIYHNQVDDIVALKEFKRVLKPGGILILRVPAISWLLSAHDKYVLTRERYNFRGLKEKLRSVGFRVDKLSYINTTLFIPALLKVLQEKIITNKNSGSVIHKVPCVVNYLLIKILSFEGFLLNYINLPIGIGLVALGTKPSLHK